MDRRISRKFLIGATAILLFALLVPAGALAHGDIQRRRPAEGATRKNPPGHVQIEFTEAPTEDSVIAVLDGCGRDVVREQYVDGRTKHVFLRRGRAEPGEWEVTHRVISAEDGHLTRGSYNFTVRGEPDCAEPEAEPEAGENGDRAAAPASSSSDGGQGFPVVPVTLGGLGIVALAALARVFSARRGA